jgi:DNA-directed RNA polymerase subunit beta'
VIFKRGGKEMKASENAYVMFLEQKGKKILYLRGQDQRLEIQNGSTFLINKGDMASAGQTLATFDPYTDPIIAEAGGRVQFIDLIVGATLDEHVDESTGNVERIVAEFSGEGREPRIAIIGDNDEQAASYFMPAEAVLSVEDGELITAGTTIARMVKQTARSSDITSGLPRVSELFEARKPKSPSVLAEVSGVVHFKSMVKGKRVIMIEDEFGKEYKHLIPGAKRLLVRDGDTVEAGDPLCQGAPDPHDILRILGEGRLQRYLMDQIQAVYRDQKVAINDKHIGVIIRQMMRKVEIVAVGDTKFIYGALADKYAFQRENDRVIAEGGQPAVGKPVFQGITKAALNIDSFLSAASFQETTRVLTNAAISASVDHLRGLKENIIIGHPIPAGTGMRAYHNVKLYDSRYDDLDVQMNEILEKRRAEEEAAAEAARIAAGEQTASVSVSDVEETEE